MPPASTGERAGSTATIRTPGSVCLSTSPTPVIVPPVPTPGDEGVEAAVGVAQDLLGRRAAVDLRVGRVVELLRHEVAVVLAHQLLGGEHGARHALDRRREDQLGAVALQQLAPLHAHVSGIVRISL